MSSPHLSVATAIEKDRIISDTAFVLLFEIDILDELHSPVETLRLCKNSENLIYRDQEYVASNFAMKLSIDAQSAPSLDVTAEDPAGYIRDRMEMYGGGVGFSVTMMVINTGNMDQPPEIKEQFKVVGASAQGYQVSFSMGVDNPVSTRFPNKLQFRDQCSYKYKGSRCKYAGSMPTCDYTYFGENGCKAHNNSANYGGFLGLQNLSAQ